jgi:hypothetical protein
MKLMTLGILNVTSPTATMAPAKKSRAGPVEGNVFARVRRPLKLEAERVDEARYRLTPSDELSGSGL